MVNKEKNFVSAVVYVYNAEKRVETFLRGITAVLEENFEHSEIICINDSSDDDSVRMIKEVAASIQHTSVSIINMSYFHGLELAMNAGVDMAIGDFVFEFDNTVLDFDLSEMMKVYRRSLQGYDIVAAVPNRKERLSSRIFYRVFEHFTDLRYKMHTESFRILSRRAINRVSDMNKTIPYRKVLYAGSGLKSDRLSYTVVGEHDLKMDMREKLHRQNVAIDSLVMFTDFGYKFSIGMTLCMMAIICIVSIYSIIAFCVSNPISGWTSTILFLSFIFFGLFGILTVIIKYLQLLIDLIFRRKSYTFEGIEKLTKH